MNELQVHGARNYRRVVMFREEDGEYKYDKIGTALMDKTIINLSNTRSRKIDVDFSYLDWWPMYLNINDQEVLMANKYDSFLLAFIGLNEYVFYYDFSFPVWVTLTDPDAFNGDGFTFNFALEANLRKNKPANGITRAVARERFSTTTRATRTKTTRAR